MNRQQKQSSKPEGTVTIDSSKSSYKKKNNDDGEYVPYEEIK